VSPCYARSRPPAASGAPASSPRSVFRSVSVKNWRYAAHRRCARSCPHISGGLHQQPGSPPPHQRPCGAGRFTRRASYRRRYPRMASMFWEGRGQTIGILAHVGDQRFQPQPEARLAVFAFIGSARSYSSLPRSTTSVVTRPIPAFSSLPSCSRHARRPHHPAGQPLLPAQWRSRMARRSERCTMLVLSCSAFQRASN
jgi:hypothetical protein